jgi:hypothetical protein
LVRQPVDERRVLIGFRPAEVVMEVSNVERPGPGGEEGPEQGHAVGTAGHGDHARPRRQGVGREERRHGVG